MNKQLNNFKEYQTKAGLNKASSKENNTIKEGDQANIKDENQN